jgi:hypothetical protein
MLAHWPHYVVVGLVIRLGIATGFGLLTMFGPEPKAAYEVEIPWVISIRIHPRGVSHSDDSPATKQSSNDGQTDAKGDPADEHGEMI